MLLARFGLLGNSSQLVLAGKSNKADSSRVSSCAHPVKGLKEMCFQTMGLWSGSRGTMQRKCDRGMKDDRAGSIRFSSGKSKYSYRSYIIAFCSFSAFFDAVLFREGMWRNNNASNIHNITSPQEHGPALPENSQGTRIGKY